jgi:inner membrane protein
MALWPLLLAALFGWWSRRRPKVARPGSSARLLLVVSLACWSHPLLDWLNNYGVRLLSPLDDRWFYGDVAFIVDPWMWLILGGAVFLARAPAARERWRWLGLAVVCAGAVLLAPVPAWARFLWVVALAAVIAIALAPWQRAAKPRAAPAWIGLVLLGAYVGGLTGLERWSRHQVAGALGREAPPSRDLMVGPMPMNPLRWQVVAQGAGGYLVGEHHLDGGGTLWSAPVERGPAAAAIEEAWSEPSVAGFARWVRFPFHRVLHEERGPVAYLLDARYTTEPTTVFGGVRVDLAQDRALGPE